MAKESIYFLEHKENGRFDLKKTGVNISKLFSELQKILFKISGASPAPSKGDTVIYSNSSRSPSPSYSNPSSQEGATGSSVCIEESEADRASQVSSVESAEITLTGLVTNSVKFC